jgi:hypothetical protein
MIRYHGCISQILVLLSNDVKFALVLLPSLVSPDPGLSPLVGAASASIYQTAMGSFFHGGDQIAKYRLFDCSPRLNGVAWIWEKAKIKYLLFCRKAYKAGVLCSFSRLELFLHPS